MPKAEQQNLLSEPTTLLNMVLSEPEMEPVKRELAKHTEEVKKLAGKVWFNNGL